MAAYLNRSQNTIMVNLDSTQEGIIRVGIMEFPLSSARREVHLIFDSVLFAEIGPDNVIPRETFTFRAFNELHDILWYRA